MGYGNMEWKEPGGNLVGTRDAPQDVGSLACNLLVIAIPPTRFRFTPPVWIRSTRRICPRMDLMSACRELKFPQSTESSIRFPDLYECCGRPQSQDRVPRRKSMDRTTLAALGTT